MSWPWPFYNCMVKKTVAKETVTLQLQTVIFILVIRFNLQITRKRCTQSMASPPSFLSNFFFFFWFLCAKHLEIKLIRRGCWLQYYNIHIHWNAMLRRFYQCGDIIRSRLFYLMFPPQILVLEVHIFWLYDSFPQPAYCLFGEDDATNRYVIIKLRAMNLQGLLYLDFFVLMAEYFENFL